MSPIVPHLRRLIAAAMMAWSLTGWAVPPSALDGLDWRLVGPFRGGWAMMAVGVPQQPDTYYLAAAGGGVWKTTDSGRTWTPPDASLAVTSIGSLAVAPSDPSVIYAGSGQITTRYDIASGNGVYKSTNAGQTWTPVGLADTQHIGRILVDPRDARQVLVAAMGHAFGTNQDRGVYRSEDGGATWLRTLFVSSDTGAVDLASDPHQPDVVFASVWQMQQKPWQSYFTPDVGARSGIYKSTDAGRTWLRVSGGGWPDHELGRIGLSVVQRGNATRVYAIVDAETDGGLWRSDDGGTNWVHANADGELVSGYFGRISVDPRDPDVLWTSGRSVHRCAKAGAECEIIKGSPGGDDYHFVWLNPLDPQRMIVAGDQGAVVSVNGGATWSSWYNQPTAQFYHVATDQRFPYWIYAGQQDSGTVAIASRSDYGAISFRDWHPVGADERDHDIPDPLDPDIVYGSGLGGRLSRWNARTGEVRNIAPWPLGSYGQRPTAFDVHYTWITPLAVSPIPPYSIYLGAQLLYRSNDRGETWQTISPDLSAKSRSGASCEGNLSHARARECGYGVIFSIAPSPLDNNEVWLGMDDGQVKLTRDGGKQWRTVTPPGVPGWAKISSVDVSPLKAGTAYVAVDNHRQDDFKPRAYVTHDFGKNWTAIATGLPKDQFVSVLRVDPARAGLLYAGTNAGVQVSLDDGAHWQSLQRNLPIAWVRDLHVHDDDLIVATQGRAIWVLDDISRMRQMSDALLAAPAHLFAPADVVRLRKNENRDTPLPPDEPVGKNPPTGAVIDYWLSKDATGPVVLEIRDGVGKVLRRFASDEPTVDIDAGRYFNAEWTKPAPRPGTSAGAHRFVWNLRLERPKATQYGYSIGAIWGEDTPIVPEGLLALPGLYRVALIVDGQQLGQGLRVIPDPRSPFDTDAAQRAATFSGELQTALLHNWRLQLQARWLKQQSAKLRKSTNEAPNPGITAALDALDVQLKPLLEGEGDKTPNLAAIGDIIGALQIDVEATDAAPIQPQRDVFSASLTRLKDADTRWNALQATQLVQLNQQLTAAALPIWTIPAAEDVHLEAKDK